MSLVVKELKDPKYPGRPRVLRLVKEGKMARYKQWEIQGRVPLFEEQKIEGNPPQLSFTLFDYQDTILEEIVPALLSPPHVFFLSLATGMGKTKIAMAIFGALGRRALVVVPTVNLAEQWKEQFSSSFTSPPSCSLGVPKQGNSPDAVILVINTARKQGTEFFSQFGLVILDEVHEYTSEVSKEVLWGAGCAKYILGLSATPDTGNGLLPFIEGHIGPVRTSNATLDTVNYSTTVIVVNYYGGDEYVEPEHTANGTISVALSLQKILTDTERTNKVVENLRRIYNLHDEIEIAKKHGLRDQEGNLLHMHKIFIFCEYREYLLSLRDILQKEGIWAEEEDKIATVLMGGSCQEDGVQARNGRVVLTTYGYSKRGVSFDDFTALIMVTPRKKEHVIDQLIGRIYRINGPRQVKRLIVDIVDVRTPFRHQYRTREEVYLKRGFTVAGCKKQGMRVPGDG